MGATRIRGAFVRVILASLARILPAAVLDKIQAIDQQLATAGSPQAA
jgi:hypothetical protein